MDIRQIQYFVALYEEGTMTRAAQRMHVVQPAISLQLKKLETHFGIKLFEREPQGLSPNPIAHEFYTHCLVVLRQLKDATELLSGSSRGLEGHVCVGAQASFNQFVMGRALTQYSAEYPCVRVQSREGYRRDLVDWIRRNEIDFALLSMGSDSLEMQVRALSREDLVVVGSRDTLEGVYEMGGTDLEDVKLVLPSENKSLRHLINSQFGLHGITLRPKLEVDAMQSLFQILTNPGWISIIPPTAFSPDLFNGSLKLVKLVRPTISRHVVVAWPRHKILSAPACRLVEGLANVMSDLPGVDMVLSGSEFE